MNSKLVAKNLLGFIYCYLIYQNILLATAFAAFAQDVEVFDAIFYSPNNGDVITNKFITVTGVVGPISEEELEEGGVIIEYELYDGSNYWRDLFFGSTEFVNSVLQEGYQIKPYGSSPPSFPPHPGTYRLTLMAKTVFTNAYIKEMTIDFEPCENECIKNEQNLGQSDECE